LPTRKPERRRKNDCRRQVGGQMRWKRAKFVRIKIPQLLIRMAERRLEKTY
jgi:hypothetical protein